MTKRKHTAEEIINKLREAEVIISAGSTVAEAARRIGVPEQTFYRRRAGRNKRRWPRRPMVHCVGPEQELEVATSREPSFQYPRFPYQIALAVTGPVLFELRSCGHTAKGRALRR